MQEWQAVDSDTFQHVTHVTWIRYEDNEEAGSVLLRTENPYPTFRYDGISQLRYESIENQIRTGREEDALESLLRGEPSDRSVDKSPPWLQPTEIKCYTCEQTSEQLFVTPSATICRLCGTVHSQELCQCLGCKETKLKYGSCHVCDDQPKGKIP